MPPGYLTIIYYLPWEQAVVPPRWWQDRWPDDW